MRLTVADLAARTTARSTTVEVEPVGGFDATSSVLFVPLPMTVPPAVVDNALASAVPAWALRNHLTVLGVHSERGDALTGDLLDDVSSRVEGAPLYLLSQNPEGWPLLRHHSGAQVEDLDETAVVAAVRDADVRSLLLRPGAHLPSTDLLHYEGPNGQHYRAFVRPGFALRTVEDLDRLSFWLLPHLRGRSRLVVDHWSLLGLAYHVAAYTARFDGSDGRVIVQALESYDEGLDSLASRLRLAFPDESDATAALLLSVNSSGALAHDVILPALVAAQQLSPAAVALAVAPPGPERPVDSLCELGDDFARHAPDLCSACAAGRPAVVPIEHDTYLMRLAAYATETEITEKDGKDAKDVVGAYAGRGVFTVHRSHTDGRHHAFYVDIMPMLDTDRFRDRLARELEPLAVEPPDAIVHPPMRAPAALASIVAEALGVERVIACDERRLKSDAEAGGVLGTADRVLVVDDVVITGRRLEGYRQQLIRLRREAGGSGLVDLRCLVALARTRKYSALKGVQNIVHHKTSAPRFAAVETLYLPDWSEAECPWCLEHRLLEGLGDAIRALPMIRDRLSLLSEPGGLADGLFLPWPSDVVDDLPLPGDEQGWKEAAQNAPNPERYAGRYWELNPGSVFGDLQGADLMVSVASSVQRLRMGPPGAVDGEPRLDEVFRSPISKTLDPNLYLLGRFYEPVLIAAILRACRAWDVRSPEADVELARRMAEHLTYLTSSGGMVGELLLQAALGRLPVVAEFARLGADGSDERQVAVALSRARA